MCHSWPNILETGFWKLRKKPSYSLSRPKHEHRSDMDCILYPHRMCGQRHIIAWQFLPVLMFWYLLYHRNLGSPHNPPWQNCIIIHPNLVINQHWNSGILGKINSLLLDPLFLSILPARNILRPEPSQRIAQQKTLQAVWNSAMVEDLISVAHWELVWGPTDCFEAESVILVVVGLGHTDWEYV